jgi:hypothetical protein
MCWGCLGLFEYFLPVLMVAHSFYFCWPGCAPGGAVTFFCFAKRKSPKKRRAEIAVPSLLNFFGGMCKLASLKQAHTLIRKSLRCSATLHGASGIGQPGQGSVRNRCGDEQILCAGRSPGVFVRERSDALLAVQRRYEEAEQRRAGRIRGDACLSEASWRRTPARPSSAGCPKRSVGTTNPAAFFFGDFLLGKQKKVTALSGARPDQSISTREKT